MSAPPLRKAARAVAIDAHRRVLLLHYAEAGGFWATPGGGLEPDEDYPTAVLRELGEELGAANVTLVAQVAERCQDHDLAGPASEEAERRLTQFGERAQFQGHVVVDERRVQRIMKRHDPAIYPGDYVTCVHDPAKALCEKARHGRAEEMPQHGGCQPLACRNVALTQENAAAWQRQLDLCDRRLAARPPLPPLLQERLRQRRTEIVAFLTDNGLLEESPA